MKVKWFMLIGLLVAVFMVAGCAPTKTPGASAPAGKVPAGYESIRLVGGQLGGKATTVVITLAMIFNKYYPEIVWSSVSGTGGTSVIYLTKGTAKLAMVPPASYIDVYTFDKVPESRIRSVVQPTPLSQFIFLIPEDKPWKDIAEVPKGTTLCPGYSVDELRACETWLKLAGLDKKDFNWLPLSKTEMTDAWRAGKLDVAFSPVSGMVAWVMDMYTSPRKFKPLGLTPEQVAKGQAQQTFERVGFLIGKTNIAEIVPEVFKYDVVSPQGPNFLVSRDDFPEDIAYKMAKVIYEHNAELAAIFPAMKYATPQFHIQWARPPMDIHSGVAKYYKEKGYLK